MESFRTEINIDKATSSIQYDSKLLFMGSCFATNIGDSFYANCFNCRVNPFGVLYNPFSIANSLSRLLSNTHFSVDEIHQQNGTFHSFFHHSSFNHPDRDTFLQHINTAFDDAVNFLGQARFLLITFGTAWVYEHQESKEVVSNCHKYPSSTFHRRLLTVSEITERYSQLLQALKRMNPTLDVIFTVSPVRHWKDGAHGNQISKASLLLAIEQLNQKFANTTYFPAYELLMDDLRDYRFYKDDLLHPSAMAIQYIRSKFSQSFLDDKANAFEENIHKLRRASEHRPFNSTSEAHQKFVHQHIQKVDISQKNYPNVSLSALKNKFKDQVV